MFTDVIQHGVNGLIMGAVVALPALGLTLIFSVLGFVNFSIAAQMTVGAYAGWLVNSHLHWPLLPALAAAFVVAGLIGIAGDRLALVPMRRRSTAHTSLMVAIVSIALNLVLENALRFGFGSDLYSYDLPIARDVRFGEIRVGPQQISNLGIALVIAIALAGFFSATRWGKAMRAVADNVDLARLKGIDPQRLSNLATFLGMGLAGIGGALLAIDTSVDPSTGSRLLLVVFAASVVGGMTSLTGAVLGALLMGVLSEVALSVVSPVYQSATAFVAILLVLLVRPNGLFSGVSGIRK